MIKMNLLELFAGTKSISRVAKKLGYKTFTSDYDKQFDSDYCIDIMEFNIDKIPFKPDVIWASPPCTAFSVAAIGKNWQQIDGQLFPKSDRARKGIEIAQKTYNIIQEINPTLWFIENPRGAMRKIHPYIEMYKNTVSYCQYGDTRMKPTDIWTNNKEWRPRKMCKNGMNCHISAPRGSRTGTQGLKNAIERSKIPEGLCYEVLLNVNKDLSLFNKEIK